MLIATYLIWFWYFTLFGIFLVITIVFAIFRKWRIALITLALGIIFGGIGWFTVYKSEHRYNEQYKQLAKEIDFTVYKPSYSLPKNSARSVGIHKQPDKQAQPYIFMQYRQGSQLSYEIYQFNISNLIVDFPNCGPNYPETINISGYSIEKDFVRKCREIGKTTNGFSVYQETNKPFSAAYATKDSTRIVIDGLIDKNDILKIVEGLQPTDVNKLNFINRD